LDAGGRETLYAFDSQFAWRQFPETSHWTAQPVLQKEVAAFVLQPSGYFTGSEGEWDKPAEPYYSVVHADSPCKNVPAIEHANDVIVALGALPRTSDDSACPAHECFFEEVD
jgi:hypothetical protein